MWRMCFFALWVQSVSSATTVQHTKVSALFTIHSRWWLVEAWWLLMSNPFILDIILYFLIPSFIWPITPGPQDFITSSLSFPIFFYFFYKLSSFPQDTVVYWQAPLSRSLSLTYSVTRATPSGCLTYSAISQSAYNFPFVFTNIFLIFSDPFPPPERDRDRERAMPTLARPEFTVDV